MKNKNVIMAIIQKNDPNRYRDRTVLPEKGQGKKQRPRKKNWTVEKESGSFRLKLNKIAKAA